MIYEKRINEKEGEEGYHSLIFGSKVAVSFYPMSISNYH